MRLAAVLLGFMCCIGDAAAAEYGLGLSAKSDTGLVYFPVDVAPRFRIEPSIRYSTEDFVVPNSPPGVPVVRRGDTRRLEVGAGFFGLAEPQESLRIYYGVRASYLDEKVVSTINADVPRRDEDNLYGYRLAPTFGFEYLFNRHFTLGGEIAYLYERLSEDQRFGSGHSEFEGEASGTESFIILRYFF